MKTDDLIVMLATGAGATDSGIVRQRLAIASGAGIVGAALLMAGLLGVRHDFAQALMLPMFWVKLAFVGSLSLLSLLAVARLARPGVALGWVSRLLAAPVLAIWLLAGMVLWQAGPEQRASLFFGDTWLVCPFLIAMLSMPAFAALTWAVRGLAPVRLRLAGAFVGLLSGALAGVIYCLHCPEMGAPFVAFWYALGMLLPALGGMLLGPRLLRW
jgi:hypothetical protein